jgi:hypothetical protein
MGFIPDVACNDHDFTAGLLDPFCCGSGIVMLIQIGQDNVRPFPGEGNRDRTPDAAIGPGNESNFAL